MTIVNLASIQAFSVALPQLHLHHSVKTALLSVEAKYTGGIDDFESIWKYPVTVRQDSQRFVSKDSTVTVLWDRATWDRHKSRHRYLRALARFPRSTIFRCLLPILVVYAAWTCVVWKFKMKITGQALSYLSTPLGLMLAFRVNSVVTRFHEARQQWGMLIFNSRNIASMLAACPNAVNEEMRVRCCRLLVAFGWAAKAYSRFETNADV